MPGESGLTATRRLLSVADEAVYADGDALQVVELDETSDYSYGPSAHPAAGIAWTLGAPGANWVRFQGPDRYAQAFDFPSLYRHGGLLDHVRNLDGDSDAKASAYADAALERLAREDPAGELVAAVNAGLELYDVVTVDADDVFGATDRKFRVLGLAVRYSRKPGARPVYEQTVALGEL